MSYKEKKMVDPCEFLTYLIAKLYMNEITGNPFEDIFANTQNITF